jgi:hypothetical protein
MQGNIEAADAELQHVPSWIFLHKYRALANLKQRVHQLAATLPKSLAFVSEMQRVLGSNDTHPHTALVIFQNDSELRPSGGFMGSYAVLTASQGTIRSFQLGKDIYKLDKELAARKVITPPPYLQTIAPSWGFRDSNVGKGFLQDIGTQVASFYEEAGGNHPDVIVWLDLSLLEDILHVTGPVQLPATGEQVTADSISTSLTTYIEKQYWDDDANKIANNPKSIIGDLIPVLLDKLHTTPGGMSTLPAIIAQAASRKSLQLWSSDPGLTAAASVIFPSDSPPKGDWLKIVNTNLGGNY